MERIEFVEHKGKQILVVDFSGCQPTEVVMITTAARQVITAQAKGSVLVLVDVTGTELDRQAITRMKEAAVFHAPYVAKSAWVGTETIPPAHFQAIKTFSQRRFFSFPDRAAALDWLAE